MPGSKTNAMNREAVLAAVRALPDDKDFVWDGKDPDDQPLSTTEMRAGMPAARIGRPPGSTKESTTIRFDADVLAALKASGPGWQTRVNDLLRAAMALRKTAPGG